MSDSTPSRAEGDVRPDDDAPDDDTIIRPVRGFYPDEEAGSSGSAAATGAGSSAPTLAERIMHRMPPPPEKAEARQEYEAKVAARDQERRQAREALQHQQQRRAEPKRHDTKGQEQQMQTASDSGSAQAKSPYARPDTAGGSEVAQGDLPTAQQPVASPASAVPASTTPASTTSAATAPASASSASTTPARETLGAESSSPLPRTSRRARKARLRIARVDPWSVMKTFFLFSIAGGIMFFTAVVVLYTVVEGSGLFDYVDTMVQDVLGTPGDDTPFRVRELLGWERVMGVTALLACINVVILTALATLGSFLYNLSATMLGGLEVTLAED